MQHLKKSLSPGTRLELGRWTRRCVVMAAMALVLIWPAPIATGKNAAAPIPGDGPELLQNPGLDGPMWFKSQCCGQDGLPINEVQVAEGWTAWWRPLPPEDVRRPDNCLGRRADYGCYWARPEFVDSARTGAASRIYSGNNSQKYFTYGRMHEAGLYQRVTGIVSGTLLHFSVYMSAWMCMNPADCQGGLYSDQPTTLHLRVGIDPTGGLDSSSPDVVWSPEQDSFDRWTPYHVEAAARGDAVTVFTHSRPEWVFPRLNNDIYVDEASLRIVQAPPRSALISEGRPSAPTSPTLAHRPQSATRPDGSVVYVVQAGDTWFSIALAYGISIDQIAQLNHLQPGDSLAVGHELIIKLPVNPVSTPTRRRRGYR